MPSVHTVLKNRKEQSCRKCGETIPVNAGYRHWSFRYGGKVTRCLKCPSPRPSELTQSGYKQQAYAAQENFEDAIVILDRSDPDAFRDAVVDLIEDVRQVADDLVNEYEDALSEWEHGNSMIEEKKEAAEEWEGMLESGKSDVENLSFEGGDERPETKEEDETDEEFEERVSEYERAVEEFCDEVEQAASDPINDCPI